MDEATALLLYNHFNNKPNKMQIKGKLHHKEEIQNVSETFRKREFILEYIESDPKYIEYIKLEVVQKTCEEINAFEVGDELEIEFNLRGRKWTDATGKVKYFNSLHAWRINRIGAPKVEHDVSKQEDDSEPLPF